MPTSHPKRVFILGAGFSKPAGFPLATELTDEVLSTIRGLMGDDYELFEFARHVQELHQWISRTDSLPRLNIEEFYDYLTVFRERFMFEHHLELVDRYAGDTAYSRAESIQAWLSTMDDFLLESLIKHEDSACMSPIQRFSETLRPGDSIITFNYDRLVERALQAQGTGWHFGLDSNASGIPVYKMHGSLDWICFARNQRAAREGVRRLFSKTDENREREQTCSERWGEPEFDFELFQIEDDRKLHRYIKDRDIIQSDFSWGLAGLGPRKRVSLIPGLGAVWDNARVSLYHADHIVIVGFSFAGFDRLAQVEFARVMAGRNANEVSPPRITAIDPCLQLSASGMSEDGKALINRISSVFHSVHPIGVCHQNFDWDLLDQAAQE